jgi:hypothetical protein
MFDLHSSTLLQPITMVWVISWSVKALSAASVGLLDSDEALIAPFLEIPPSWRVIFYGDTLIRVTAAQHADPSHKHSSTLHPFMRRCLLPSLRLGTRTVTPICLKQFVRFVETKWMVLARMSWSITTEVKIES